MARKDTKPQFEIGDPDYLPPQLITGRTPEEKDADVAARIKDGLVGILDAMGTLPDIAEGRCEPDIRSMQAHYDTVGVLLRKLKQRIEFRNVEEEVEEVNKASSSRKKNRRTSSVANEFD